MKKIVFLQGPPRCGKDTIGSMLEEELYVGHTNTEVLKFAAPINGWMMSTFGVDCNDGHDKETGCWELQGKSRRETAIWYSEEVMKPRFGIDVFGEIMVNKIKKIRCDFIIVTDSGFKDEAIPVVEEFGPERCISIKVSREGRDFSNDSRGYWDMEGVETVEFDNKYNSLQDLRQAVSDNLVEAVSKPEWM